jgi:glycosyltransferase involved in cell wall biosynthesis
LVIDNQTLAPVSVIIPAYNAAATIRRALASVGSQTIRPRQVIVVDDGSQDETVALAREATTLLGSIDVQIIVQPNKGAGAARNRALGEARYDFVAFLDADDEWLPTKLEESLTRHAARPLQLVAHNGWVVKNGEERYLDIAGRVRAMAHDPIHGLYRRGSISTSSVVARRQSVLDAGGFDETLRTGQDFDLWLKMLGSPTAAYEVFDEPLTRYHVADTGITGNTARRLDNTLRIAVRHAPRLRRETGRFAASLWFRVLAVHVEAVTSFAQRRNYAGVLGTLVRLPIRIVTSTWVVLTGGER